METAKIKVKIGDNEFEAEGPVEDVKAQFDVFKELLNSTAIHRLPQESGKTAQSVENTTKNAEPPHIPIEKVLHAAGRVISLTALPASTVDAALLIMLGHKDMRNHVSVTGQEIGDGLAQSGRPVPRVDRIMDKAIEEAQVLKTGIKRGTRYRLTNQGLIKALGVAAELIQSLP
ncbi:MAG: hypothetical protein WA485_26290 [Candidatus Sulfotelmatobacter sp.]